MSLTVVCFSPKIDISQNPNQEVYRVKENKINLKICILVGNFFVETTIHRLRGFSASKEPGLVRYWEVLTGLYRCCYCGGEQSVDSNTNLVSYQSFLQLWSLPNHYCSTSLSSNYNAKSSSESFHKEQKIIFNATVL